MILFGTDQVPRSYICSLFFSTTLVLWFKKQSETKISAPKYHVQDISGNLR